MTSTLPSRMAAGPFPDGDGWAWLYRAFERSAPLPGVVRRTVCSYFYPKEIERRRRGLLYRALGVHLFGAVIPTGGIVVRRMTRAKMTPYTLAGCSLGAAREFYFRSCVFEALHLPFLLAMAALAAHRAAIGRIDLAIEDTIVNVLLNVHPVMHHRRTRARILELLDRRTRNTGRGDSAQAG